MENNSNGEVARFIGVVLLLAGAALVIFGFGKSGAAEFSDTLNIGLLNDKTNLVIAGGLISVCGSVFYGAGYIVRTLIKNARADETPSKATPEDA